MTQLTRKFVVRMLESPRRHELGGPRGLIGWDGILPDQIEGHLLLEGDGHLESAATTRFHTTATRHRVLPETGRPPRRPSAHVVHGGGLWRELVHHFESLTVVTGPRSL